MLAVGAVRLAADGFLLRRRPLPLRDRRRHHDGDLRGDLLLVSQGDGANAVRAARPLALLLFVIGFHLTFDTLHVPGLLGMPRRIYTYEASRGWGTLNFIATIGVAFQGAAVLVFRLERRALAARRESPPATIRGTRGRSSGPSRRRRRRTTSRSSRPCGAAGRCGTSSIRTIRTGSTNERTGRRASDASRTLGAARPRQGGDGVPDRRRGGDLHDLRRRVRLLSRQERHGAPAPGCAGPSGLHLDLPVFVERHDHSRGQRPPRRTASRRSAPGGPRRSFSRSFSWPAPGSNGDG